MARISAVSPENASGEVQEMYGILKKKVGKVINIFQMMGNSPAVLGAYMALSEAAGKTSFDAKMRERIALLVGESNKCHYCLAAHTAVAKMAGLSEEETIQARKAKSEDVRTQAILGFAKRVVDTNANVDAQEVAALKDAGVSDKELVELILLISLNGFTNYLNHIVDTDLDFPEPPAL
jgi:uncharacterized peroxidase-related enzyme